jgi:hypothetical protein
LPELPKEINKMTTEQRENALVEYGIANQEQIFKQVHDKVLKAEGNKNYVNPDEFREYLDQA